MASVKTDVPLKCTCGSVRGVARHVSPESGHRLVCLCDDCQAYAHWLGRARDLLDEHGGTDIFQMTPAQLKIGEGAAHIRCVRLSTKGLLRWYTACCKTPIGNTLSSPKLPFVGVPHLFMDHEGDRRSRDQVLGPIRARVQGRFAKGKTPADAHKSVPVGIIVSSIVKLLGGWIRREYSPSPLFDAKAGKPIVEPIVLSRDERERLRALCGPG